MNLILIVFYLEIHKSIESPYIPECMEFLKFDINMCALMKICNTGLELWHSFKNLFKKKLKWKISFKFELYGIWIYNTLISQGLQYWRVKICVSKSYSHHPHSTKRKVWISIPGFCSPLLDAQLVTL